MSEQPRSVRRAINPPSMPAAPGWSHAVAAGGWLFGSGLMATDYRDGLRVEARIDPDRPWSSEPLDHESRLILDDLGAILEAAGCDRRRDLVRLWQWIRARYPDDAIYAAGEPAWPAFPSGTPYARNLAAMVGDQLRSSTGIGVRQLAVPEALLSVDFIAVEPRPGVEKQGFAMPDDVPQPRIGYSPATRIGDWVFLAGFGATDFKGDWMATAHMGKPGMVAPEARVNPYIWLGSEIETQTDYTLRTLAKIAAAAGTSLARCVKADVTLRHPSDVAGMERVWRRYFPDEPPARNLVTGAELVVKGARVEIALLLLADDSGLSRRSITLTDGPAPPGHAPHAVHAGDFLFTSGLLALDEEGRVPAAWRAGTGVPHFRSPAREQTEAILQTLARLCTEAGATLADVCKVQAFFDDLAHLPEMLGGWRAAFPQDPPALSVMAMGGGDPLIAPGAVMQWDAIVHAPIR
ncbi:MULTISPECIES: RidA family protein [unclassified Sphingomonas]|uniref:RidA family protein n=1 Tax=unclassified Sphingomonas TaxID=196159 RepID=UPI0006F8DC34|nr:MULTISPECIES: RidA family protein [unclassified Sphingomonas]KQX23316.1 hypothetical protein ASD17_03100 [Sphingomonas sp. Root1294]KQY68164.1 hypothetical protein ASD39_05620 [Sphingomonas sp. Root50]KRB91057.1 hypothetical protein ASE22_12415 [Sphingomonas sp. Root720]